MIIKNLFILIFFVPSISYAYMDPGSGSLIIQAIVGVIASCVFFIKIFWFKIKKFFNKLKNLFR